jgi:hypothetical protein
MQKAITEAQTAPECNAKNPFAVYHCVFVSLPAKFGDWTPAVRLYRAEDVSL